jgi:hypothetical protein
VFNLGDWSFIPKINSFLALSRDIFSSVIFSIILTYIIPILNIFILVILKNSFSIEAIIDLNVINILLATNACFIVTGINLMYNNGKKRQVFFLGLIFILCIDLILFLISTLNAQGIKIDLSMETYRTLLFVIFLVAVLFFIIGKNDELNDTQVFANKSRKLDKVNIGEKEIQL